MSIDTLNNSQLMLLTLLLTIVTSVAMAIATIALLFDVIVPEQTSTEPPQKTTVIEKTINTIIERSVAPTSENRLSQDSTDVEGVDTGVLSDDFSIFNTVYFGTTEASTVVTLSPNGVLLAFSPLDTNRRYSMQNETGDIYFDVITTTDRYSLLKPVETYVPEAHFTATAPADISIGDPVIVYGGAGDSAQLHLEHIVQSTTDDSGVRIFKTSLSGEGIPSPSFVYSGEVPIGVVLEGDAWVIVLNDVKDVL